MLIERQELSSQKCVVEPYFVRAARHQGYQNLTGNRKMKTILFAAAAFAAARILSNLYYNGQFNQLPAPERNLRRRYL